MSNFKVVQFIDRTEGLTVWEEVVDFSKTTEEDLLPWETNILRNADKIDLLGVAPSDEIVTPNWKFDKIIAE